MTTHALFEELANREFYMARNDGARLAALQHGNGRSISRAGLERLREDERYHIEIIHYLSRKQQEEITRGLAK